MLCLAVTVLIGYSILSIILGRSGLFSFREKLALSYGVGIGAASLQMLIYYFLNIHYTLMNLLVLWVPVVAAAAAKAIAGLSVNVGIIAVFERNIQSEITKKIILGKDFFISPPYEKFLIWCFKKYERIL